MANSCEDLSSVIYLSADDQHLEVEVFESTYLCCNVDVVHIVGQIKHWTMSSRVEDGIVLRRIYFR